MKPFEFTTLCRQMLDTPAKARPLAVMQGIHHTPKELKCIKHLRALLQRESHDRSPRIGAPSETLPPMPH